MEGFITAKGFEMGGGVSARVTGEGGDVVYKERKTEIAREDERNKKKKISSGLPCMHNRGMFQHVEEYQLELQCCSSLSSFRQHFLLCPLQRC